jgi:hypothetical protein
MKKLQYNVLNIFLLIGLLFIVSCADDPAPTLMDIPDGGQPAPIITSVTPQDVALAGVTVLTISGSNFATDIENISVTFNGIKGTILSVTNNEIKVRAANVVADTVKIKVASYKSENFSNIVNYKLLTASEEYFVFDPNNGQIPYAFIFKNSGDMLVSIDNLGIKKITPEKVLSDYIPKGNAQKWDCLKFGPNFELYGSRTINAIWNLVEGIAPSSTWVTLTSGTFAKDIEFDSNNNMWVVGAANKILKIDQSKVITTYTVTGTFRSARVFNNALYIAGTNGATEGVWKVPILANGDLDIANQELYFDLWISAPGKLALAITFAADGDLILGTDQDPDPLIVVHPSKNSEVLYPGIIKAGKVIYLFWAPTSNSLFFTREVKKDGTGKIILSQTVIRVEMQKPGAIYYGN